MYKRVCLLKENNTQKTIDSINAMTTDSLAKVVANSLETPDLNSFKKANSSFWKGQLKAFVSVIPVVGGVVAEELQQLYDYKDDEFFRKFTRYLLGMANTTKEERLKFADDIQKKAEDYSGNVILGMVDRLDNINKQAVFANLSVARIKGQISIEDFFRLHYLLERTPYVDLKELHQYEKPFYDSSGDTELLFATGALEMVTIDSNETNKYSLSRLGEMLLKWGLNVEISIEHGKGTSVEQGAISKMEIEEIVSRRIDYNKPKVIGDTLVFQDGS